jgi:hypothetical protein
MRTTLISALFLLGATPIALAQGGYGPAPAPLDRSGMKESQVVLPIPKTPGTLAPAPATDPVPAGDVQATLSVPDVPGTLAPAPAIDPVPVGDIPVTLPVPTEPGTAVGAPKVDLYFVEPTMAFAPGLVELRGNNLHLVRQVLVAGIEVPIVFNNGRRMLIAPENQAPGFANLELIRVGGRLDAPIEFTPTVRAEWRGGMARVQIHPNMEGWHMVMYSFRRLDNAQTYANTYGAAMLDLNGPQCGVLCDGVQPDHEPITLPWMRVPYGPNLLGPMHVQGLVLAGDQLSYTNTITIQPHL